MQRKGYAATRQPTRFSYATRLNGFKADAARQRRAGCGYRGAGGGGKPAHPARRASWCGMIDVAVAGSLHLDIMAQAPRLPMPDETPIGSAWAHKCGGKGGNQAVAAARLGAKVAFGGQTGDDDSGARLRQNLVAAGAGISCVGPDKTPGSGMSVAITEQGGERAGRQGDPQRSACAGDRQRAPRSCRCAAGEPRRGGDDVRQVRARDGAGTPPRVPPP